MKPLLTMIGCLGGILLSGAVMGAVDHLTHRHDAAGVIPEVLIIICLTLLGGLIGAGADR